MRTAAHDGILAAQRRQRTRAQRFRASGPSLRAAPAPASPDFSGWNWVAESGPFSTAATKRSPWVAQVTWGDGGERPGGCSAPTRARRRSARSRTAPPATPAKSTDRRGTSTLDQPMCGTTRRDAAATTMPGHSPMPGDRRLARLARPLEHHLHADAHAEHRAGPPPAARR